MTEMELLLRFPIGSKFTVKLPSPGNYIVGKSDTVIGHNAPYIRSFGGLYLPNEITPIEQPENEDGK